MKNELSIESEGLLPQSDLNNLDGKDFPTIEEQTDKLKKLKS